MKVTIPMLLCLVAELASADARVLTASLARRGESDLGDDLLFSLMARQDFGHDQIDDLFPRGGNVKRTLLGTLEHVAEKVVDKKAAAAPKLASKVATKPVESVKPATLPKVSQDNKSKATVKTGASGGCLGKRADGTLYRRMMCENGPDQNAKNAQQQAANVQQQSANAKQQKNNEKQGNNNIAQAADNLEQKHHNKVQQDGNAKQEHSNAQQQEKNGKQLENNNMQERLNTHQQVANNAQEAKNTAQKDSNLQQQRDNDATRKAIDKSKPSKLDKCLDFASGACTIAAGAVTLTGLQRMQKNPDDPSGYPLAMAGGAATLAAGVFTAAKEPLKKCIGAACKVAQAGYNHFRGQNQNPAPAAPSHEALHVRSLVRRGLLRDVLVKRGVPAPMVARYVQLDSQRYPARNLARRSVSLDMMDDLIWS